MDTNPKLRVYLACTFRMIYSRSIVSEQVNVSAMEGQFYRKNKSAKHPHTNMAKAALNMMTRTAANEFADDGAFNIAKLIVCIHFLFA